MIFLIDFENVSSSAFVGVEELKADSKIILFYSEQSSKISIDTHRQLEQAKVEKEYIPIKTGGKNALDFQLVTYLGYLIGENKDENYVIISNDNGFDHVCKFWKQRSVNVQKCANLMMESKEKMNTEFSKLLDPESVDISKVVAIVDKYKTKQGINNALVKEFGTEKTGIIYKAIKCQISNKK